MFQIFASSESAGKLELNILASAHLLISQGQELLVRWNKHTQAVFADPFWCVLFMVWKHRHSFTHQAVSAGSDWAHHHEGLTVFLFYCQKEQHNPFPHPLGLSLSLWDCQCFWWHPTINPDPGLVDRVVTGFSQCKSSFLRIKRILSFYVEPKRQRAHLSVTQPYVILGSDSSIQSWIHVYNLIRPRLMFIKCSLRFQLFRLWAADKK